jgi:acyl-CoA thioesterase FadM
VERWLAERGVSVFEHGWDFMLKKATIEWAGAATVHEVLDIAVTATRWGNTSFDVLFDGRVEGRPVFTCIITYVGVKLGTRETMPPPPEVRSLLGG